LTYYVNLTKGRRRLHQLHEAATSPFFDCRTGSIHGSKSEQLRLCVNLLHTEITTMTAKLPLLLDDTSNASNIASLMPYLMDPMDEVDLYPGKCPLCESVQPASATVATKQRDGYDIGAKFEACRNQLIWHYRDLQSRNHLMNIERIIEKLQEYERLAEQLVSDASDTLKSLLGKEIAKLSRTIGLYHDDRIIRLDEIATVKDCLRRTALHRWLDQLRRPTDADLTQLQYLTPRASDCTVDSINELDILGRSPLYLACHKGWTEGVVALLRAGADPTICTVHNTSPLHYAAAEGRTEICKALLECRPAVAKVEDCNSKTAFDYACQERHMETASMILQVSSGLSGSVMCAASTGAQI
jgi:hypothetical protein